MFGCDLPSICIVVWPCAGVEGLSNHMQRPQKEPGTPEVKDLPRANRAMEQEEGARHGDRSVMENHTRRCQSDCPATIAC